jgi:hypothetical protein
MHHSPKLNEKAIRFYKTILERFPDSDRRVDDAFHEELAGIAKECEISGKELATNPKRRRRDSLFEKEELIPSARADVTWCEGVLHGGCLCGAMRFDTTGKIFDASTVTTVAGNIAEALPY